MTTDTNNSTSQPNRPVEQIQRLAWIIVLVSFALFCSISVASTGGIYYFFFRSTIPLDTILQVGRGTVPVNTVNSTLVVRSSTLIYLVDRGSTVETDEQSQATISFQLKDENVAHGLGTITLHNNSNITFNSARRPRFEWSDGFYNVNMSDFKGKADILITKTPDDRPFSLIIRTLEDTSFLIDQPGRYSIVANNTNIKLISYEGKAILLAPVAEHNRLVSSDEQATLRTGGNVPVVSSRPVDLLENGSFTLEAASAQGEFIPQRWACFRRFDEPPSGNWFADEWDGRPALRLIRAENATTNGETGCLQVLAPELGLDVSEYSLLELKSTFLINYQSLQNCGQVGSECPMMLIIDYIDTDGVERRWTQGIFYNFEPQSPWPLICQSCGSINEHLQISEKVWYTYESGNLINRLPAEQRPAYIQQVQFYASGHQYDVFVSEMALFAGTGQAPFVVAPETNSD